ncbi:unnamed protein product [Lactuca saligna]|uniref:Uncharacterized protein n=1 Tax=Lactuca saligna TaxID=75948 RepID=A0AA35YI43_LACSI|nr:unnamed protein product [Lactuca saligna]
MKQGTVIWKATQVLTLQDSGPQHPIYIGLPTPPQTKVRIPLLRRSKIASPYKPNIRLTGSILLFWLYKGKLNISVDIDGGFVTTKIGLTFERKFYEALQLLDEMLEQGCISYWSSQQPNHGHTATFVNIYHPPQPVTTSAVDHWPVVDRVVWTWWDLQQQLVSISSNNPNQLKSTGLTTTKVTNFNNQNPKPKKVRFAFGQLHIGSGVRWTLVDFLRGHGDEQISALSWSPGGRYPK